MNRLQPPLLVAIEGPDNAGKSTLCASLATVLERDHGLEVCCRTSVDFERPTGPALRRAMNRMQAEDPPSHEALRRMHLLFLANRLNAFTHEPDMTEMRVADVILFDRYTLSGYVYAKLDGCVDMIAEIESRIGEPADATILLDLPVDEAKKRTTFGDGFRESLAFQHTSTSAFRNVPADYPPAGVVYPMSAMVAPKVLVGATAAIILHMLNR